MDIDHSVGRYAMRYWLTDLAVDDPTDSMVRQHIYAAMNREQIRLAMPRKHLYITNKDETYQQRKQEDEIKRRLKAVAEVDLFHTLSNDEMSNLAERVEYRPYAQSDVIFREGTTDPWLYIIIAGQAEIHVRAESGAIEHAFTLGPGDTFGELGLMTGAPRSATVVAGSALETYRLGKQDFTEMLQSRSDMIEEISHIMVTRQTALQKARDHLQEASIQHSSEHSVHELVDKIKQFIGIGN